MKNFDAQPSLISNETSIAAEALTKMTKLFSESRLPPQAALDKIVNYFHRLEKPVFIGQVALYVGYSIEQTEAMLAALIDVGVIRIMTRDEKNVQGMDPRACVYTLTDLARPSLANW